MLLLPLEFSQYIISTRVAVLTVCSDLVCTMVGVDRAGVAEQADAWDLKSQVLRDVPVRVRAPAPSNRWSIILRICGRKTCVRYSGH